MPRVAIVLFLRLICQTEYSIVCSVGVVFQSS